MYIPKKEETGGKKNHFHNERELLPSIGHPRSILFVCLLFIHLFIPFMFKRIIILKLLFTWKYGEKFSIVRKKNYESNNRITHNKGINSILDIPSISPELNTELL